MFKKDHSELLFYILRQLAQDQLTFQRNTTEMEALTIEIDEKDLMDKVRHLLNIVQLIIHWLSSQYRYFLLFQAKQIDIRDLKPFYHSKIFESNDFVYDAKRKVIIHTLPESMITDD